MREGVCAEADRFANGILARPEAPRGQIADHHYLRRALPVSAGEPPAAQQRNLHRPEIVRRDKMDPHGWLGSGRRFRPIPKPDYRSAAAPGESMAVAHAR